MNPYVITYVSDTDHPGFNALRESCQAWGWPLIGVTGEWKGEGNRLKQVLARCRDLPATHAVHVDAFDVRAVGPPDALEAALAQYGNPALLLSCEGALWPYSPTAEQKYGPKESHWWYAHSQFVLDLQQPWPAGFGDLADDASDQQHLHNLYGVPGIALDRQCAAIQSIAHCKPWQDYFEIEGNRIRNKRTGTLPLFAHGNGRTPMEWVP